MLTCFEMSQLKSAHAHEYLCMNSCQEMKNTIHHGKLGGEPQRNHEGLYLWRMRADGAFNPNSIDALHE